MIPQVNKISINLMESIESETSIDSPDKEIANMDLNDMDDSKNDPKSQNDNELSPKNAEEEKDDSDRISSQSYKLDSPKRDILTIPKLDFSVKPQFRTTTSESEASKNSSFREESRNSRSDNMENNMEQKCSPLVKISNTSIASDLRSPKFELIDRPPWSPSFKLSPNKALSPQIKTPDSNPSLSKGLPMKSSDSNPSLSKGLPIKSSDSNHSLSKPLKSYDSSPTISKSLAASPRLDGVIISQGKSQNGEPGNVVVMYQFDTPKDDAYPKQMKPAELSKEMEKNKVDERRRLELSLQKELDELRTEWATKEKRMRIELQEELRESEERFKEEKRVKLMEQADRLRKEMEQVHFHINIYL